jgi:outer membrane protein
MVFLIALVMLNTTAVLLHAAEDRVGFIDAPRVLSSHPKYAESQKYMEEFVRKKTEESMAAAEKETDQRKRQEIIDTARMESGNEESRVMTPITKDINKVIESVAKAKGVTVVLNKMLIYFGGVDLTEDVIKGLKELKF